MSHWYVMQTAAGNEQTVLKLMQQKVSASLWEQCRILRKQKLFRSAGELLLNTECMFPGYLFIQTNFPGELKGELDRARKFPKLLGSQSFVFTSIEKKDLTFIKKVCGEELEHEMGLSRVQVDEQGDFLSIEGSLKLYENKIVRKRLRKRYVIVSVPLFGRIEEVLFGIVLPKDRMVVNFSNIQNQKKIS